MQIRFALLFDGGIERLEVLLAVDGNDHLLPNQHLVLCGWVR